MSSHSQAAATLLIGLNGNASQANVAAAAAAAAAPQSVADARSRYEADAARYEEARRALEFTRAAMEASRDNLVEVARDVTNAALHGTGLVTHIENDTTSAVRPVTGPPSPAPRASGPSRRRASGQRRSRPDPRHGSRSTRHTMVEGVAVYEAAAAVPAQGPAPLPARPPPLEDASDGEALPVAPSTPVDLKRALHAIDGARRSVNGRYFKGPVPLDIYQDYLEHVEEPTDLYNIRGKLKQAAEVTIGMIDDHLSHMERNAEIYSAAHPGLNHVSEAARAVRAKMIHRLMQPLL